MQVHKPTVLRHVIPKVLASGRFCDFVFCCVDVSALSALFRCKTETVPAEPKHRFLGLVWIGDEFGSFRIFLALCA
jgi:hypothetical protein